MGLAQILLTARPVSIGAGALDQVETPIITEPSANFINISCGTIGATIFYRVNSGVWEIYVAEFLVSPLDVIDSYATADGLADSEIATYTVGT